MRRRFLCVLVVVCCGLAVPALLVAQSLGTTKPAGKEPTLSIGGLLLRIDGQDDQDKVLTRFQVIF